MNWIIEYYNEALEASIANLPAEILASYIELSSLLIDSGANLRLPYSRAMGNGLFELRLKGKEGIARVFYCRSVGYRIVILHAFIKKTEQTPHKELVMAVRRMREINYGKKH